MGDAKKEMCGKCKQRKPEKEVVAGICAECINEARVWDDIAWITGTGRFGQ